VELYPWKSLSELNSTKRQQVGVNPTGIETALNYKKLLDSPDVQNRADLARILGVTRARVTQVLRRLRRDATGPNAQG
jgi:DNA-binding MarR family transcriptional regulator